MSGRANFIVPKGARVGAKNSCNALGFVVSSPVATLLGSFYNSKIATRSKNKRTNKQTSSALHALRAYVLNSNQSILYLQYFQNLLKRFTLIPRPRVDRLYWKLPHQPFTQNIIFEKKSLKAHLR